MSNELSERVCRKMGIEPMKSLIDGALIYPDLLTPEWAGRLLAMLWNKGFGVSVHLVKDQPRANVILLPIGIAVWADTMAEAVCLAIDAMPEGA